MNEKNGKRKFGLRDKVGYALGDVGSNLTLTMMQSYMLVFYTKVLGVPGAVIGTVLLLAKFVDSFTDMAMGRIIDTHTDKRGERFRPWIRRFAIPVVVSSVLLYNIFIEGWTMGAKIAYMTIVYLIYGSICYTGVTIPYGAMVSAMTSDPEEKAGLSAFRNVGAFLAAMVTGAIIPQFVYTKDSAGNEIANGPRFLMIAVIFGIFALISFFLCYRWSVERICIPNKEKEDDKSNLWSSMKQVFSDRALLSIIIISICMSSALGVIQSMNQYLFLDYFKNTSLLSVAGLAMMACMLLPAPIAPKLSGKIGKKEVSIGGIGVAIVLYIIIFISRTHMPSFYIAGMLIASLGLGFFGMVSYAMIGDCIDNYYIKHGERADGTIYAIYCFTRALGVAVTGSTSAWMLSGIGYDNQAVVQTESVSQAVFNITVLTPLAFMVVAFIVFVFMYPLSKAKVESNVAKIKELQEKIPEENE